MREQHPPNIVILVPHDLGQHVGCYGVGTVHSENIDRLASEGVRFANSFCTAPQCSPSRASIFTGRFPHSNGVMGLTHGTFAWDLHDDERHLSEILREAGWHTGLVQYGHEARLGREQERFDEILPGGDGPARAEHAVAFFHRHRDDGPFFLEIPFDETHRADIGFDCAPDWLEKGIYVPPYLVDEISSREEFAWFQGLVRKLDGAVGRIIQGLDGAGLGEDTIVVFTADHGIPFPRAKCSLYDPGLEVPLILRRKGAAWANGTVHECLISNVDYVPTLLDLVGVPIPGNVQGRSFAPLLRGEPYEERAEIFAEMTYHDYCDPRRCIRTETHKLIVNFTTAPFFMDPSQTWRPKCVTVHPERPRYAYHPPVELYDLRDDPLEFSNLADEYAHRGIRRELLDRLCTWMKETDDPLLEGIPVSPMHKMAWEALTGESA
jgi:N-sulfoglucosamine sulfohydrolase